MNVENLTKLAAYLESLPANYQHFHMGSWQIVQNAWKERIDWENPYSWDCSLSPAPVSTNICGTAGCAIGHAPNAGIEPGKRETWWAYAARVTGMDTSYTEWQYCFDGRWERYDNTPHGAARRIREVLAGKEIDTWVDLPWWRGK